ncbi:MAG: phage integrase SAM-like domain-containing protein [Saprospiraceae bacterium]
MAKPLKSYGKAIKTEIDFDMIDWKFRDEFQNWLYDEPRSHSANNVSKIFEVLKKFLKLSFRDKHHTNTIFQESDFGVKRVKVRTKI